uniref:G protein-coupled receptor n=1 Tax=Bursaphelenchus xylophilus TaxID=6326 RepID=A0A1I7RME9_BURXY
MQRSLWPREELKKNLERCLPASKGLPRLASKKQPKIFSKVHHTILGVQLNIDDTFRLLYLFVYLKIQNGLIIYDPALDVGYGLPMWVKSIHISGLDMAVLTGVVLGLERIVATYFADRNYSAQKPTFGILLAVFDVVAANGHSYFLAWYQYHTISKECRIRPLMEADASEFRFGFQKGIICCIMGCIAFAGIYVWGKRRVHHNYTYTLDVKFQINHNMSTVRTLYIVMAGYLVCVGLGQVWFIVWSPYTNTRSCTDADYQLIVLFGHYWINLYYYFYIYGIVNWSSQKTRRGRRVLPISEADHLKAIQSTWQLEPASTKKGFALRELVKEVVKSLSELFI